MIFTKKEKKKKEERQYANFIDLTKLRLWFF